MIHLILFKLIQVQFDSRLFSREFLRLFQNVGSFATTTFIIESIELQKVHQQANTVRRSIEIV